MLTGVKQAVITGGSRGIGAAICSLYAKNGANIALIYRQDQAKAAQLQAQLAVYPVKISIYPANVADAGQVGLTFQKIAADFGFEIGALAVTGVTIKSDFCRYQLI